MSPVTLILVLLFFSYFFRTHIDAIAVGKYSILRIHRYTKTIVENLDDPLYVEYIRSEPKGTRNRNDVRYIEIILLKIKRIGRGRISLDIRQPQEGEESQLDDYGFVRLIQQAPDGTPESLYSGIKLTYRDKFKILPLVLSPADLEFSMVNAIKELQGSPLPLVTFLSGRDQQELSISHSQLLDSVGSVFPTAVIMQNDPLPIDTGILIIVNYEDLAERWTVSTNEFLKDGKDLVVLGSGIRLQPDISDFGEDPGNVPFKIFMENQGLDINPFLIAKEPGVWIQDPEGNGTIAYPLWFSAEPAEGILDSFDNLVYLWGSPVFLKNENFNVQSVESAFIIGDPYPIRPGLKYPDEWKSDTNTIPVAANIQMNQNGSLTYLSSSYSFSDMALSMGYSSHFSMMLDFLLKLSGSSELAELRTPVPQSEITSPVPYPLRLVLWIFIFPVGALILFFAGKRRRTQ